MSQLTDWLLSGPPWVQYRTRLDLLDEPEDAPQVIAARQAIRCISSPLSLTWDYGSTIQVYAR